MALTYSQWIWGFEVFDATVPASQNNLLVFDRPAPGGPGAVTATLTAGVYTVDEFELHVAAAMNAVDSNGYRCIFNYTTLKFTIDDNGGQTFYFRFAGANGDDSPANLLGFATGADLGPANTFTSTYAAGTSPSTAGAWTAAEPLSSMSPVIAQPAGTAAQLSQRVVKTLQHISDGASVESVHLSTMRSVQIAFRALLPSEQTNMEKFLDWVVTGKRFTWQPDKTSSNLMKLVIANPAQINNTFEWLTRSEASYGTLTFFEQLS